MIIRPRILPIVANDHRSNVCPRQFSGELDAAYRCHDPASVNQLIGSVEQLQPIEEERPLLRVEQREPLIEQYLSDVGFDLGEVRIDCPIQREILPDSPTCIPAELALSLIILAVAKCRGPIGTCNKCRRRLEYESTFQVMKSIQRS